MHLKSIIEEVSVPNIQLDQKEEKEPEFEVPQRQLYHVPDPILKWGAVEDGGMISKAELMSAPPVFAVMENFDFDVKLRITSFKLTFSKDGSIISLMSNSNKCTSEMRDVLGKLGASDVVYVEDALVELPGGLLRTMPSMKVEVY